GEGWLVEGDFVDGCQGESRLKGDEGAGAQPEHVVRPGRVEERVDVLALGFQAVVIAGRAAQAAPTTVRQVHGERVRQCCGQLHKVLCGLHAAVDGDDARTVTELAVADGRAVVRRDGAGRICRWF